MPDALPISSGTMLPVQDGRAVSAIPPMAEVHRPRHSATVRVTHWLTTLSFLALLVTGVEILISHPRFYWGETGNVNMTPMFSIPIPSSRASVPTGYGYVLPDQNGWSRYLHFQSAWVAVLTGLIYVAFGFFTRTFPAQSVSRPLRPFSGEALGSHYRAFAFPAAERRRRVVV